MRVSPLLYFCPLGGLCGNSSEHFAPATDDVKKTMHASKESEYYKRRQQQQQQRESTSVVRHGGGIAKQRRERVRWVATIPAMIMVLMVVEESKADRS